MTGCGILQVVPWDVPTVLTAPAAGTKCFQGIGLVPPGNLTVTMSAWDYAGWTMSLYNGPNPMAATLKAILTPAVPAVTLPRSPELNWFWKIVSTGPGSVTIHQT